MTYHQITSEERYTLAVLRRQEPKLSQAQIARCMGRHPSTISREIRRNSCTDNAYRPRKASRRTRGRRSRSRRNIQFTAEHIQLVEELVREKWSPEQISGTLRQDGLFSISHETIYKHIWRDRANGGQLFQSLRQSPKRFRKRYGRRDSRGRLTGKKLISERPAIVETRTELGHWEMDVVVGHGNKHCILSLVERVSGYVLIGKLIDRTANVATERAIQLIQSQSFPCKTITVDNGPEFHSYRTIEHATGVQIFFANPYHSWERGTNENTNGLIRQYLPKRTSMLRLTQHQCNEIAFKLNTRPRKRHCYKSPLERIRNG